MTPTQRGVPHGGLVSFSGIDCAGKSTQIELLRRAFTVGGRAVKVMWLRPGYSWALDRARALVRRVRPRMLPSVADPVGRARVFGTPGVERLWAFVALVDAIVHYSVVVRWSLLRGETVICDRYVDDALLDLGLRFPNLDIEKSMLARALRRVAAKPDTAILLVIPREEMTSRMERKCEPFPDAPEVRERRYDAYRHMAANGRYEVIDGARPALVVHDDVLSRVSQER